MFPVPFRIVFSHPTQVSQTDIEVSNGVVSNFKQESTTDLLVEVTPQAAGEVTLALSSSIHSVTGIPLRSSPSMTVTYAGATLSSASILAYANYALVSVTASKPVQLHAIVFPRRLAVTPSFSVVTTTGIALRPTDAERSYSVNITSLSPTTDYVLYLAGREPFGPEVATPIVDTRTSFSTVKEGEKPSEGKQCPRGWTFQDGLLLYTQCSDNGVCVDSACSCYPSFEGASCGEIRGEEIAANATHAILHTLFTLNGELFDEDEEEEVFMRRTLQTAAAAALEMTASAVQIRLWEKTVKIQMLRGLQGSERLPRKGIFPFVSAEKQRGSLYVHVGEEMRIQHR